MYLKKFHLNGTSVLPEEISLEWSPHRISCTELRSWFKITLTLGRIRVKINIYVSRLHQRGDKFHRSPTAMSFSVLLVYTSREKKQPKRKTNLINRTFDSVPPVLGNKYTLPPLPLPRTLQKSTIRCCRFFLSHLVDLHHLTHFLPPDRLVVGQEDTWVQTEMVELCSLR